MKIKKQTKARSRQSINWYKNIKIKKFKYKNKNKEVIKKIKQLIINNNKLQHYNNN